jgi:hypothetical protein
MHNLLHFKDDKLQQPAALDLYHHGIERAEPGETRRAAALTIDGARRGMLSAR